jgi:hypothetical protein
MRVLASPCLSPLGTFNYGGVAPCSPAGRKLQILRGPWIDYGNEHPMKKPIFGVWSEFNRRHMVFGKPLRIDMNHPDRFAALVGKEVTPDNGRHFRLVQFHQVSPLDLDAVPSASHLNRKYATS